MRVKVYVRLDISVILRSSLKLIFLLTCFSLGALADGQAGLAYRITPVSLEEGSKLKISVSFDGSTSGVTRIRLPSKWASQLDLHRAVRNLKLSPENAAFEKNEKSEVRIIRHRPGAKLTVDYELVQYKESALFGGRGGGYSPIVQPGYFHFIGTGGWIYPDWGKEKNVRIKLEWNRLPKGWSVANSFGALHRRQEFSTTLGKFSYAVFTGGDFRVSKHLVDQRPVFVAMRGNWKFGDADFTALVSRIVRLEREFWRENDQPYYLVTLLALKPQGPGISISGTGLTNSFATFVTPNATLERLGWLIAHEYFHNWNYQGFGGLTSPEQLLYWFSEGFTDYYTYLLLLRGELIDLRDYIRSYNRLSRSYYTSPARNVKNERIVKDFFRNGDVHDIPYRRGFLLATRWNALIRKHTEGKSSLDDVMRDLLRGARKGKYKRLSKEIIVKHLSAYSNHDFRGEIEKYIENGETIPELINELGDCVRLTRTKVDGFDLGFDFTVSREKGEITGLSKGSNAYKAGLREGQKLKGFSIRNGNTKQPVVIGVVIDGEVRQIRYLPRTRQKIDVPVYSLVDDRTDRELEKCLETIGKESRR